MMVFPADHSGRLVLAALVLAAVLMGLLAAALLVAGNIARAQDATTHQITRGTTDAALTTSLNAVFDSDGVTLAAVKAGDTIEFGAGLYEDIGRKNGFYLWLNKANLTVRGARDPRLGAASGQCDPGRGHHPDRVQRLRSPRCEYHGRAFLLPGHRRRQPGSWVSA